jgi:hypothetical protein
MEQAVKGYSVAKWPTSHNVPARITCYYYPLSVLSTFVYNTQSDIEGYYDDERKEKKTYMREKKRQRNTDRMRNVPYGAESNYK